MTMKSTIPGFGAVYSGSLIKFRRNVLPPSSGSKSMPRVSDDSGMYTSLWSECSYLHFAYCILVACLAYSSILKMEPVRYYEKFLNLW
jgi:hypothetical protein